MNTPTNKYYLCSVATLCVAIFSSSVGLLKYYRKKVHDLVLLDRD